MLCQSCVGRVYWARMTQAFYQANLASFSIWMSIINIYHARDAHKGFVDDFRNFARPETSAGFLVTLFLCFHYFKSSPSRIFLIYNPDEVLPDGRKLTMWNHATRWIAGNTEADKDTRLATTTTTTATTVPSTQKLRERGAEECVAMVEAKTTRGESDSVAVDLVLTDDCAARTASSAAPVKHTRRQTHHDQRQLGGGGVAYQPLLPEYRALR